MRRNIGLSLVAGLLAIVVAAIPSAAARLSTDALLNGNVVDADGQPLSGTHDVQLSYFAPRGTEPLLVETHRAVALDHGRFVVAFGAGEVDAERSRTSLGELFAAHPELSLEVTVDGVVQSPRIGVLPAGHSHETRALAMGAESKDGDQHSKGYRVRSTATAVQAATLRPAGSAPEDPYTDTHKSNPFLVEMEFQGVSPAVRDLPAWEPELAKAGEKGKESGREINPIRHENLYDEDGILYGTRTEKVDDRLALESEIATGRATPSMDLNFAGIGATSYSPPDTEGAVGPNHYVQVVNVAFRVFDKSGNPLTAQTLTKNLWSGAGGACASDNDGDAIFMYDEPADRWVLTQFAISSGQAVCFAVSTTPDPTGTYYRYQMNATRFPDYYKLGVWPDPANNAYFMGTNTGYAAQYDVYAVDRANLLAGTTPRAAQLFQNHANLLMPADLDGDNLPPAGSPGLFYTFRDGGESYFNPPSSVDTMDLWEFDVDWTTPANSTLTQVQNLVPPQLADFNWTVCGFFTSSCLEQPSGGVTIDSASWWPMQRLQYRNFNTHETLAGTWTVDVNSSGNRAAPRWFELRRSGGSWSIYQQGTHSPDTTHRFMGSAALDGSGNMALGYSVTSSSVNPGLRYATRPVGASTFDAEAVMIAGGGVETGVNRWGDYASMEVDPADDCTFWFTSEYIASTGSYNWATRIGSFKLATCGCQLSINPLTIAAVANGANNIKVSWTDSTTTQISEYQVFRSLTGGGTYSLVDTVSDSSPGVSSGAPYNWYDTTVSGGSTYYYKVYASDGAACVSAASNEAHATATGACLLAPTFAGVAAVSNPGEATCALDVAWSAGASQCGNSVTYDVYRSTTSGFTPGAGNLVANGVSGTSYHDAANVPYNVPVYYVVRAKDSVNGVSDPNLVEDGAIATGVVSTSTWSDTLEGYANLPAAVLAGWSHAAATGTDNWALASGGDHTTGSGKAFSAAQISTTNDEHMASPEIGVIATTQLTFWHKYGFEGSSTFYDGGVLEVSTNGGSSWTDLGASATGGGYGGTLSTCCDNPIGGRQAWVGTVSLWTQVTVPLAAYNGQTVKLRWRMGNDSTAVGTAPWMIDDIVVTDAGVAGACTPGTVVAAIFDDGFESGSYSAWDSYTP